MKGLKNMRAIKLLKRFAAVILAVAGLMMFSGCGADGANGGNIVEAQIDGSGTLTAINRASKPIQKPGGGKFTLAYVDIDPYNETFRMLYYVIESLKDDGWISYGELPFDPETDSDSLALMDWLADNAESDYMAFDKTAHYYTTVSSEEEIRESLQKHIENHEIDAILSMGTSPSLMLEPFGFDIPLLMYAVSDPIGSGLIESADDSGNKNYWAHVDSSAYSRQMQYYYDTFGFSKIGSVYGDEIVCAIPDYTASRRKTASLSWATSWSAKRSPTRTSITIALRAFTAEWSGRTASTRTYSTRTLFPRLRRPPSL